LGTGRTLYVVHVDSAFYPPWDGKMSVSLWLSSNIKGDVLLKQPIGGLERG